MHVANKGGIIIFITLNKYLKTKYGEGLRKKLKEKDVDIIIDFLSFLFLKPVPIQPLQK
jgi:hypothetical protein